MSLSTPGFSISIALSQANLLERLECQAMPNFIKHMYREYLEGYTDIIKVDEDLTLAPGGSGKLFIQKNRYSNNWTALNTCVGHQGERTFCHEALAAAYLQGADEIQLIVLDDIFDRAKQKGSMTGGESLTHCCLMPLRAEANRLRQIP